MEQHLQDVAQNYTMEKFYIFTDHSVQHFLQKPNPRQCCEIDILDIVSTVKPTSSLKIWSKSYCALYIKDIFKILKHI